MPATPSWSVRSWTSCGAHCPATATRVRPRRWSPRSRRRTRPRAARSDRGPRAASVRLLITAVVGGSPVDLAVDAEDDARVGDLAGVLADAFPRAAREPVSSGPPELRVV